jgi:CheY-like chemotaxis protein
VRTLLFESVRELLFNAFKYAKAARVTVQSSLESDDRLAISVTDDGIGFDPGRLDDQETTGHIGWGLFSIRERLSLLGGTVEIDSAPGRGTQVRLVAPRSSVLDQRTNGASSAQASSPQPASSDGHPPSVQALTVLIVDDHASVRRKLRARLDDRQELCVVGEASNGLEAIASAHALRPHVIIMDVAMPRMDGIEATARISAELPHIAIFALSMERGADTARAMTQAGAAGYFVKEVDMPRLIDQLLAVHATRSHGGHAIS